MAELFALADDITGALDTGVRFAARGVETLVITEGAADFNGAEVIVMCAPTRHMSARRAYERVFAEVRGAADAGVSYIFKKTDSVLRGNVGAELEAALNASGARALDFLPAFPALGRTTLNGVQLLRGKPICESEFSSDPFEPVTISDIAEIIARQSRVKCVNARVGGDVPDDGGICIYDSETDADLRAWANKIQIARGLRVMAGCAGLAGVLTDALNLKTAAPREFSPHKNLIAVCGSLNPVARAQARYAEDNGFARITLDEIQRVNREAISDDFIKSLIDISNSGAPLLLDAHDGGRVVAERGAVIAANLGYVVAKMIDGGVKATILATGGDTLAGVLSEMNCASVRPIREIESGVALCECLRAGASAPIISKAGGFGGEDLFVHVRNMLKA